MSKPNKDGWIRHRGWKCPVDEYEAVDVRKRNGLTDTGSAGVFAWKHHGFSNEVMAYRLYKPEQVEPAVVVNVDAFNAMPKMVVDNAKDLAAALDHITDQPDVPLQWRDRIREIDSTVEALEEERVSLVQKLEAEGFRLIDPVKAEVVESVEYMSDWRDWRVGDLVKVAYENDCCLPVGSIFKIRSLENADYDGHMPVSVHVGSDFEWPEAFDSSVSCPFKWHSRPSA